MKHILLEDDDFKLEVAKEIDDNLRLTNIYKNGIHTDEEEMILTKDQQRAILAFLLKDEILIQTCHIKTKAVARFSEPERFYLVIDRENDTLLLAAVDYDFSITMGISTFRSDVNRFHSINLFNAEMKAYIVQQIIDKVM